MTAEPELRQWGSRALAHVAGRSSGDPLDPTLRITLAFHPDVVVEGATVLERMALDGRYRSQFETQTSNGGLSAHPGGDRWRWESRLFGGAYDEALASARPVYGALDHRRRPLGGSPRFGSAHLRLRPSVLHRATFCFPDSVFEPTATGTAEACDLLRLADDFAAVRRTDTDESTVGGVLDDYVEAQVHGTVCIHADVEALVMDPSYRGTSIEEQGRRLGVPVEWHEGRRLTVDELDGHPGFRGPGPVALGRRVALDGALDAAAIGAARRSGRHDPQDLKRLWHLVARFGARVES